MAPRRIDLIMPNEPRHERIDDKGNGRDLLRLTAYRPATCIAGVVIHPWSWVIRGDAADEACGNLVIVIPSIIAIVVDVAVLLDRDDRGGEQLPQLG